MLVIDDFLHIEDWMYFNKNELWQERHRNTWFSCDKEVEFFYEAISKSIWNTWNKDHIYACQGYEYWTHILSESNPMPWHKDKDEKYHMKTGEFVFPVMASVLYGEHKDLSGGYLEINNGSDIECIEPVPNRLVIFDGSKPHRVSNVRNGERRTFACNLWDRKVEAFEINAD
jgi:hypothetical protein